MSCNRDEALAKIGTRVQLRDYAEEVVYRTTADNYFTPKPGTMPPTQPVDEGARPWCHTCFTTNVLRKEKRNSGWRTMKCGNMPAGSTICCSRCWRIFSCGTCRGVWGKKRQH